MCWFLSRSFYRSSGFLAVHLNLFVHFRLGNRYPLPFRGSGVPLAQERKKKLGIQLRKSRPVDAGVAGAWSDS